MLGERVELGVGHGLERLEWGLVIVESGPIVSRRLWSTCWRRRGVSSGGRLGWWRTHVDLFFLLLFVCERESASGQKSLSRQKERRDQYLIPRFVVYVPSTSQSVRYDILLFPYEPTFCEMDQNKANHPKGCLNNTNTNTDRSEFNQSEFSETNTKPPQLPRKTSRLSRICWMTGGSLVTCALIHLIARHLWHSEWILSAKRLHSLHLTHREWINLSEKVVSTIHATISSKLAHGMLLAIVCWNYSFAFLVMTRTNGSSSCCFPLFCIVCFMTHRYDV